MARREVKTRLDISSSRPTPRAPGSGATRRDGAPGAADFVGPCLVCSSTRRPGPPRHPPAGLPSRPCDLIRPSLRQFMEPDQPGDPFEVSDADTMPGWISPQARTPDQVAILTREGCPHCSPRQGAAVGSRLRLCGGSPAAPDPQPGGRRRHRPPDGDAGVHQRRAHRWRRRTRAVGRSAAQGGLRRSIGRRFAPRAGGPHHRIGERTWTPSIALTSLSSARARPGLRPTALPPPPASGPCSSRPALMAQPAPASDACPASCSSLRPRPPTPGPAGTPSGCDWRAMFASTARP